MYMATCKDCRNCRAYAHYWVCKKVGHGRTNPPIALELEGVETCDYYMPRNTPFFFQSTLSKYIKAEAEAEA